MSIRLHIQTLARTAFYPQEEEALGLRLSSLLLERLKPGGRPPRPALFLFFEDLVQVVDLSPLLQKGIHTQRAIAAFSSLEGLETMALVAVLDRRAPGSPPSRVAGAFLERPDGRWWMSVQPMEGDGPLPEPTILRACDGASKPRGLGGWYSLARFFELRVRLEAAQEEVLH